MQASTGVSKNMVKCSSIGKTKLYYCLGSMNGCHSAMPIYGGDNGVYTFGSDPCLMSRHAGITGNEGGYFKVTTLGVCDKFQATNQNGVQTLEWKAEWECAQVAKSDLELEVNPEQICGEVTISNCAGSVQCTEMTPSSRVFGNNPYSSLSSKCMSACHAGISKMNESTLFFTYPTVIRNAYVGETKNGIQSASVYGLSTNFAIKPFTQKLNHVYNPKLCGDIFNQHIAFRCLGGGCTNKELAVWGSNPYTFDSNCCRAAVHAGVLTPGAGGSFKAVKAGYFSSFPPSLRNGVQTEAWDQQYLGFQVV